MKREVNIEDVKKLAQSFRTGIERAKQACELDGDAVFSRFPCGCCGDTCDLLAKFFWQYEIRATYISGTNYVDNPFESQTHAWLLIDREVIVDITGDQFKFKDRFYKFDKEVYVGQNHPFYALFEVAPTRDVREYHSSQFLTHRLELLYQKIIKYVEP